MARFFFCTISLKMLSLDNFINIKVSNMENILLLSFDNQEIVNFLQPIDWMFLVFLFLIFALFQSIVLGIGFLIFGVPERNGAPDYLTPSVIFIFIGSCIAIGIFIISYECSQVNKIDVLKSDYYSSLDNIEQEYVKNVLMKDDLDKFEINSKFENGDNSISLGELDGIMSKIKTYRKNNSEKSPHYIEKERENKELSELLKNDTP